LFRQHAPAIAALGLSMLQSAEEADDLVQDVFLRAWGALDRLEDRAAVRPWLVTIAIRLAKTRLRRRKLTRLFFAPQEVGEEQVAAPGPLPEHRDLVRRLHAVLGELPVELHIAWVLRYVQGETLEDVAAMCGWSLSKAKRHIAAAQSRVTASLEKAPDRKGKRA
jgi:RNA polymerase sigma-70 factor, ECF subfamily